MSPHPETKWLLSMAFVPNMDYVDIYINGEYQENNQLSEKIEIAEQRLNICNLERKMELMNPELEFDLLQFTEGTVEDFPALKWVDGLQVSSG